MGRHAMTTEENGRTCCLPPQVRRGPSPEKLMAPSFTGTSTDLREHTPFFCGRGDARQASGRSS